MAQDFISDEEMNMKVGDQPVGSPVTTDQSMPNFVPDQNFISDDEKYSTLPQSVLAGAEAIGRGASFGLSTPLELASGLTTKEAIRGREEQNPELDVLGTGVGAAGITTATGGLGGIAAGVESGLARHALGSAIEGALFGAGNTISDAALGDPNLNAQKIMANIGFGAALGGGIGALSKGLAVLPAMLRKEPQQLAETAEAPKTSWNLGWKMPAEEGEAPVSNYNAIDAAKTVLKAANVIANPYGAAVKLGLGKVGQMLKNLPDHAVEAGMMNADTALKINNLFKFKEQMTQKVQDLAENALEKGSLNSSSIGAASRLSDKEYDRITDQLNHYNNFPDQLLEDTSEPLHHMYNAAPNVTQSLQNTFMNSVSFLHSKIPSPPPQFPLSQPWSPSSLQKATFSKFYAAVNDPTIALKQVKTGSLNNETMEALQATHPQLLQEMQSNVMKGLNLDKARKLPYFQRLSLSKFLGTALDATMTQQGVAMNNNAFTPLPAPLNANGGKSKRPTTGGLKELDVAGRVATRTQQDREED